MGTRLAKLRAENRRLLRFALIDSVVGGMIAYPLLIAAKLAWDLPEHDWWRVALGPLIGFGGLLAGIWFISRQEIREAQQFEDLA